MKIDLSKLRGNPEAPLLVVDLLMVLLVLFNLAWIVFNAMFGVQWFQAGIALASPGFHAWYRDTIHPDFLEYDAVFVAIYVTELLLRWAIAIFRRTYHRWFFYPFVHWYDVLGCIPVGSFRWLRVLRVVALLWRLQKEGVLDLRDTWLVRTARKYLDIVTEEISDRVVLNVLDGVQAEVARGNPVVHRIGNEVLAPRRDAFVGWLAGHLQDGVAASWEEHRPALHAWLARAVAEGMDASSELKRLEQLPVVGPALAGALDAAVADIARSIVDRAATDLTDSTTHAYLQATLASLLAGGGTRDEQLARLVRETLLETLGIVKQQVALQEWKVREATGYYD